ncbi:MAG: phosphoenolpyruvate mutase [bacterium]|nr:phosphoenolpyruvate mutase [bacterium]
MIKAEKFRKLLTSQDLDFACEAHNGISAKIVEEAGFKAIWASGLTMSAAMGVRDNNEASWTQVLDILEQMSDVTTIPIMVDADTGYGNFNNVRRLVAKLEQRGIAAMCIEDKLFPKTNSFLRGESQQLADIDEFCGKIKAAKDTQTDPNFSVVARVEALIAGLGLKEALKRANAYHKAGADAILIHSKVSKPDEILAFKREWGNKCPVVIVPTTYYQTPLETFKDAGFSMIIWANMTLRSAIQSMQTTVTRLAKSQSIVDIEDSLVSVAEIFRLQGDPELKEAEKRYLPVTAAKAVSIILAASQGKELGDLTKDKPKAMLEVGGRSLLQRQIDTLNEIGVRRISAVVGFGKDRVAKHLPNLVQIVNDDHGVTQEGYSLWLGLKSLPAEHCDKTLITYGDVVYKKYIPSILLEADGDIVIGVDVNWRSGESENNYTDLVACSEHFRKSISDRPITLKKMGSDVVGSDVCGEWIGLMALSATGLGSVRRVLADIEKTNPQRLKTLRMAELYNELVKRGQEIRVVYVTGHWLDVDDLKDFDRANYF